MELFNKNSGIVATSPIARCLLRMVSSKEKGLNSREVVWSEVPVEIKEVF